MNEDEKIVPILAIVPVDPQDRLEEYRDVPYNVSPFHIKHHCEKCDVVGWIGPRQLTMKNLNPEIKVICSNCLLEMGKEQGIDIFENTKTLGD